MKIRERLALVRKLVPLGPSRYGQLYASKADTQRAYQRITLWTIFQSDEGTHLVRPHVFESKKDGRTPEEWHAWLARNVDDIQRTDVLNGLNDRTGRTYFIFKRIGWIGHARKLAHSAAVGQKWRPTKSQGKSREQNHIRRGHGDA